MIPLLPLLGAIPWRLVAIAATAVALFAYGHHQGAASVQTEWDKAKAEQAAQHAKDVARALLAQQSLQAQIDNERKASREEVTRINRLHAAAVDSLRQRPERPAAGVPDAPGVGTPARGCTGADLYREDATVALGIARDADIIRAALNECRAGYQAAKDQLDGLAGEVNGRAAP